MNRWKRYGIVLFAVLILTMHDFGGAVLYNSTYAPIVFFLCYIFLMAEPLNQINIMTLSRYQSLKTLMIGYMKRQIVYCFIYTALFSMVVLLSNLIFQILGMGSIVPIRTLIKFFTVSYINLLILSYMLLLVRLLAGKWISLAAASCCVLISVVQNIFITRAVTPFIFKTAFFPQLKMIIDYRTLLGYAIYLFILLILTILLTKKDRKV